MSKISTKTLRKYGDQYIKLLMSHFRRNKHFSTTFFRLMFKNSNQPNLLTYDVKTVLKIIYMEQGLYTQVLMIRQKNLDHRK